MKNPIQGRHCRQCEHYKKYSFKSLKEIEKQNIFLKKPWVKRLEKEGELHLFCCEFNKENMVLWPPWTHGHNYNKNKNCPKLKTKGMKNVTRY